MAEEITTAQNVFNFVSNNQLIAGTIVVILGAIIGAIFENSPRKRLMRYIKKANKLLAKAYNERAIKNYVKDARELFSKANKKNKEFGNESQYINSMAHVGIAEVNLYGKDIGLDEIIERINEILKEDKYNGDAYFIRGRAYSLKGKHKEAIEDFTAHGMNKDYDRAIGDYCHVLEKNPNDVNTLTSRGLAYYSKEDYDHAIADFSRTLEMEPDNVIFLNGDYDSAISYYDRALKLTPDNVDAFYNRARAYSFKGDYKCALSDYNSVLKIIPGHEEALKAIAMLKSNVIE